MIARRVICFVLLLFLGGCGKYEERERETGYRGAARLNPYLAATRFLHECGYEVRSITGWEKPTRRDQMMVMAASALSNEGFVRQMREWVKGGGHLVLLVERAGTETSDWSDFNPQVKIGDVLRDFLAEAGIEVVGADDGGEVKAEKVSWGKKHYQVDSLSHLGVKARGHKLRAFGTSGYGKGRISVLADARPIRNRFIDDGEHAALLLELAGWSEARGRVTFLLGTELSFWSMLCQKGWPALLGIGAVLVLWLWKTMPRFGPLDQADDGLVVRAYDHHIEALGGFAWRMDRCSESLAALRAEVQERMNRRMARAGLRDADWFEQAGLLAGIPRERVERAMSPAPVSDEATFTRVAADLQKMIHSLP
jgi:hypothetical protein